MAQLYALKEDLDMLSTQIKDMKKGYGTLDYIAKSFESFEEEQLFQSVQIGRIFTRLERVETGIKDLQRRMAIAEDRLDRMEKILLLICAKLKIDTSSL